MARKATRTTAAVDGGRDETGIEPLMTVPEVAAVLRLSRKGVYSLVEARRIPFVRVANRVRFVRSDVVRWLRENRVPASEQIR